MMLAVPVAVVMCDTGWTYTHSPVAAPSPKTDTRDGSAAAGFSPHLVTTTFFESLAFLLPFGLFFFY